MLQQKETSGLFFSYYDKKSEKANLGHSEFHTNCVPPAKREEAAILTEDKSGKKLTEKELREQDRISQDQIWKDAIIKEAEAAKLWKEDWGFMLEYDEKGNPIEPPNQSDKIQSVFSDKIPDTQGRSYGYQIMHTEASQELAKLDWTLSTGKGKKKLDNELLTY